MKRLENDLSHVKWFHESCIAPTLRMVFLAGVGLFSLMLTGAQAFGQELPPPSYLFVEVDDTAGQPISDANLTVTSAKGAEVFNSRTDGQGTVKNSLYQWTPSRYTVEVSKPGYLPFKDIADSYPSRRAPGLTILVGEIFDGTQDFSDPVSKSPPNKIVLLKIPEKPGVPRALWDEDKSRHFLLAAKLGDAVTVQKMLGEGVNASTKDKNGVQAIAWAAFSGDVDTVNALLEAGAKIKERNTWANRILLLLLAEGYKDVYGPELQKTSPQERNDNVLRLIKAGADVNAKDPHRGIVLNIAVRLAPNVISIATLKALIDAGANVNSSDDGGNTPLMSAAAAGTMETIQLLLASGAGASINVKDKRGETPLHHALRTWSATQSARVKLLIEAGANVNDADFEGKTPLMLAADFTPIEVVRTLVESGSSIEATDKEGKNPLMYSVSSFKEDTTKFLLQIGASVNAKDESGSTALMTACIKSGNDSNIRVVRALLDAKADISVVNKNGETALSHSARWYSEDVLALLLKSGAGSTVNLKDSTGSTPLMYIMEYQFALSGVKLLLTAGARVDEVNNEGQTALMLAARSGSLEMLRALLASGAKNLINFKDKKGRTALMYVTERYNSRDSAKMKNELIAAGATGRTEL